jgi:hypothetical protein
MPFLANMFKYQHISSTGTRNKAPRLGARLDKARSSNALAGQTAELPVRDQSTGSYNSSLFAVLIVRNSYGAAGGRETCLRFARRSGLLLA